MKVRPFESDDLDEVVELVRAIWIGDEVFEHADGLAGEKFQTAYVARNSGERLIGVAASYATRHPHRFVTVDVAKSERRKGVGSELLEAIRQSSADRPLITRLRPWDDVSHRFFESHGFELVETAWSCVVKPTKQEIGRWVAMTLGADDRGFEPTELSGKAQIEEAAELLARWYEDVHEYSPPRAFTTSEAVEFFVERSTPWSLTAVEISGEIVGAGTLMDDPFGVDTDMGHLAWAGAHPEASVDSQEVVAVLYAEMLRRAAEMSKQVRFEISDVYPPGQRVVSTMPVEVTPELHLLAEELDERADGFSLTQQDSMERHGRAD